MAYIVQQKDIDAILMAQKQLYAKIELLDRAMRPIDLLEGVVIEGTCSIDAESDIRRTCDLTMHIEDESLLLGEYKKIWLDKFVRVYIGIKIVRGKEPIWYNVGTYLFTETSYVFDTSSNTISLTCCDLMGNLNGQMNGELPAIQTIIEEGAVIRECLVDTVSSLGFVTKYIIDDVLVGGQSATVPYDLKFSSGNSVFDIVTKLRDLYPGWEAFFDVDGVFIFQQIPTCMDDDIVLDEDIMDQIVISENRTTNLENIRNSIIVWGVLKEDGTQIKGSCQDTNPDSPFSIAKLGVKTKVCDGGDYAKIYTDDLANQRAEYELYLSTRLEDSISLEMLLVPWLDVNKKIRYCSPVDGETHDYIIKSISFDFSSGTMSVEAIRFYPLYPTVVSY